MLNIEGKENFIIRNSLFDLPAIGCASGNAGRAQARRAGIRYSKSVM
jgi:hypothetical protein